MEEQHKKFLAENHIKYLLSLEKSKDLDSIGYYLTDHLRMAGAYWSLNSLECLDVQIGEEKQQQLFAWVKSCQNADGGFGGNTLHDSHITSTHYAILVLILMTTLRPTEGTHR